MKYCTQPPIIKTKTKTRITKPVMIIASKISGMINRSNLSTVCRTSWNKGIDNVFNEVIVENSPNLEKDLDI